MAFHPSLPILATLDGNDTIVHIGDIDVDRLLRQSGAAPAPKYITAKIALVGDGSVGKTTLGHRLITGDFKTFPRTHGQQFWSFPSLSTTRHDGAECEAVLWDLAGQADYRLTHALFVDDADVALVLFNASDRHQPLKGVEYWMNALQHRKDRPCRTILVGAQVDTGDVAITPEELTTFCDDKKISGGYLPVSARSGVGLEALVAQLKAQIPWDEFPATVTTTTFKRVKEYVLGLKAEKESPRTLVSPHELRAMLEATDASWRFTDAEMMTAVGHLEDHGYVTLLRTTSGEQRVLLAADLLINVTASIVLEARRNPKGLGALKEGDLLRNGYPLPELQRLSDDERSVLLDAAAALFLEHNVCFRETLGNEPLLIFPALIHQVKPASLDVETVDDVSYEVTGSTERLYAAMVVLLGYTNTFVRTNQWQDQAQYETAPHEVCGFRQIAERDGQVSLGLYYGAGTSPHTKRLFEGLFETFLLAHDVGVTRYPALDCPQCHYRQERASVVRRIREKKKLMGCAECGNQLALSGPGELALQPREERAVREEGTVARHRTAYETALAFVKGLVRDRATAPRSVSCFLSYAWGDPAHERWVAQLARDLLNADVQVVLDQRDGAAIGTTIARFITDGIENSDFVVVAATPRYLDKYKNKVSAAGSIVAAEVDLIDQRLTASEARKRTVLPLLREGEPTAALPPLMRGKNRADFRVDEAYFASLLDLVLTLHSIPVTDPAVADLRETLRAFNRR